MSVSRLGMNENESDRGVQCADRKIRDRVGRVENRFPNPSSRAWSQLLQHLKNKDAEGAFLFFPKSVSFHYICNDGACFDMCKLRFMGTKMAC